MPSTPEPISPRGYSALILATERHVGWIGPADRVWKSALVLLGLNAWEFKIREMQAHGLHFGQDLSEEEYNAL